MKFDFIIGNPPYQEEVKEGTIQAKPIYHLFVSESQKITNSTLVMITPARWFSGGMGLDTYRGEMLSSHKIPRIYEYANAKECFPMNSISGGVCIISWDKNYDGACEFINVMNGVETRRTRCLDEYPILVRDNNAVDIIHKVLEITPATMNKIVSPISPFAISTKERGNKERTDDTDCRLFSSGGMSFIERSKVTKGLEYLDKYKAMLSQTGAEHAGEPSKDGMFRVLSSSMRVLNPGDICTHSYIVIGLFDNEQSAENVIKYLKTRFTRFLVLQAVASIHISKTTFSFVPEQDFTNGSDINWNNSIRNIETQLYQKYKLTDAEIGVIESKVKEMA